MPTKPITVALETTPKKTFAAALEWPGWCRSAREPDAAMEALADYAERYAPIAEAAGFPLPSAITLQEVDRQPGGPATAFGVPEKTFDADCAAVTPAAAKRLAALVSAAWTYLDDVASHTPEELRKGPRGGGRDRDKMLRHVIEAENSYARQLGVKVPMPELDDTDALEVQRQAIVAVLGARSDGSPVHKWTTRYGARRVAWHVLDHAWEMEDKNPNNPT